VKCRSQVLSGISISDWKQLESCVAGSRHYAADAVEERVELSADDACTANDCDGQQGSNQAIFNCRSAGFVLEETSENLGPEYLLTLV